jgi:hypothetical protein
MLWSEVELEFKKECYDQRLSWNLATSDHNIPFSIPAQPLTITFLFKFQLSL